MKVSTKKSVRLFDCSNVQRGLTPQLHTFYGVIISNLFMLPLCAKLKEQAIESELIMNITIEGILAMNNMEHPLKIEERIRGCREEEIEFLKGIGNTVTAQNVSGLT